MIVMELVYAALFSFFLYFVIFFPSRYILKRWLPSTDPTEEILLSLTFGIITFTLIGYLLSWISLSPLLLLTTPIGFLFWLHKKHTMPFFPTVPQKIFMGLMVVSAIFGFTVVGKGFLGSSFRNATDDIIHLGYIQELIHHFPPDNPGFAGLPLKGYHFFYDFFIALVHKATLIPAHRLYFQYIAFGLSFLWTLGAYTIGLLWTKKSAGGWWSVLFSIFGGSAAYIFLLQDLPVPGLNAGLGIDQPISALANPPFSISVVFLITFITLLIRFTHRYEKNYLFFMSFLVGSAPVFKIYGGIILYGGMGLLWIIALLKGKVRDVLLSVGICATLTLTTFFPFLGKGNYLIFAPLWSPHRVMEFNLPWYGFPEKLETYTRLSVLKGILQIEFDAISIFVLGNLGTRVIGVLAFLFIAFRKKLSDPLVGVIITCMGLVALGLTMFFIQSGKVFETIQFGWYFPILFSFPAAYGVWAVTKRMSQKLVYGGIVLILAVATLPSAYDTLAASYRWYRGTEVIHLAQDPRMQMLTFLAAQGTYNDTALEIPAGSDVSAVGIMRWYKNTLPFIPAFGDKRSYFSSQNIDFPNMHHEPRVELIKTIIQAGLPEGKNAAQVAKALKNAGIVYIIRENQLAYLEQTHVIKQIFHKGPYFVYHVL